LERYGPGGLTFGNGLSGGNFWNPLIEIIGLDVDDNIINENHQHHLPTLHDQLRSVEIDLIAGFKRIYNMHKQAIEQLKALDLRIYPNKEIHQLINCRFCSMSNMRRSRPGHFPIQKMKTSDFRTFKKI
jgi:hypothetical protein